MTAASTQLPAVVALGGGHGLSATLRALRPLAERLTAVVTVADNGGSSGRLRKEFDCLPPGDLRMALASLTEENEWGRQWRDVLQHRFSGEGELDNHALGNLLIVALWQLLGDDVEGLDWVGRLLNIHGRVVPMSSSPLVIAAEVADAEQDSPSRIVKGQVQVATTQGHINRVWLEPEDAQAHPAALNAISEADWIIFGPGSWYTSVLPHLILPSLREALIAAPARKAVLLNLTTQAGETDGMSAADHLAVLSEAAPGLEVDVVIADPSSVDNENELRETCEKLGAHMLIAPVRASVGACHHDATLLSQALAEAFTSTHPTA